MARTSAVWGGQPQRRSSQQKRPRRRATSGTAATATTRVWPPAADEPTGTSERTWELVLRSWTSPPLSGNDRRHWSSRYRIEKALQLEVAWLAYEQRIPAQHGPVVIRLVWEVADRRKRDKDNRVATMKPCQDGLVHAGVIPDDTSDLVDFRSPAIRNTGTKRVLLEVHGHG